MSQDVLKKIIVSILCYVLVLGSTVNAAKNSLSSFDILAPAIFQAEYIDTVIEGNDYTVTVNVTDNAAIKQVQLFYRVIGFLKFSQLPMKLIKNTHDYQVSIAAKNIKNSGFEYYIQAKDTSENESFHGHYFSPLSVTLIANTSAESIVVNELTSSAIAPQENSIFTNKWFWIGVGVLVAGAASGGGSEPPTTTTSLIIGAGELVIP